VKTNADDRGNYRLFGISPGRYYLAVGTPLESLRLLMLANPAQTPPQNSDSKSSVNDAFYRLARSFSQRSMIR
jgi:hypothetical protein